MKLEDEKAAAAKLERVKQLTQEAANANKAAIKLKEERKLQEKELENEIIAYQKMKDQQLEEEHE